MTDPGVSATAGETPSAMAETARPDERYGQ